MRYEESVVLELKTQYSKTFLKTVSAFANQQDGVIIFGVNDNGKIIGVEGSKELRHSIENAINDTITPIPEYRLSTDMIESKEIVMLSVFRGLQVPYLYKGKAYMRSDTSTVEADSYRLRQWILELTNMEYDTMTFAPEIEPTFAFLKRKLNDFLGLKTFNNDTLITLGLKKKDVFTNAANLFSDNNSFRFGVDAVKYGKDINELVNRMRLTNTSILKQYYDTMSFFDQYYHDYEVISKGERIKRVRIPRDAFREALANAIVHRDYLVRGNIQIEFWDSHIQITSPGTLPVGMKKEYYLEGQVSLPRNEILANIFYRLGIIETLGTGVTRIREKYRKYRQIPIFVIDDNHIMIILPVIDYSIKEEIDDRKEVIVEALMGGELSRSDIQKALGFGATLTSMYLNEMIEEGRVLKIGAGRMTKYRLLQ